MARTAWYSVPPTTTHLPRSSSMGMDMHHPPQLHAAWLVELPGELPGISDILHVTVPSVRQDRDGWPRASSARAVGGFEQAPWAGPDCTPWGG